MITIRELSQKLKHQVVRDLMRNPEGLDDPYIFMDGERRTKREIANEVEAETEIGIKILSGMLYLALDLLARQKEKSEIIK